MKRRWMIFASVLLLVGGGAGLGLLGTRKDIGVTLTFIGFTNEITSISTGNPSFAFVSMHETKPLFVASNSGSAAVAFNYRTRPEDFWITNGVKQLRPGHCLLFCKGPSPWLNPGQSVVFEGIYCSESENWRADLSYEPAVGHGQLWGWAYVKGGPITRALLDRLDQIPPTRTRRATSGVMTNRPPERWQPNRWQPNITKPPPPLSDPNTCCE